MYLQLNSRGIPICCITVELTGKVLFSAIRPQALGLASRFGFHEPFEVPEIVEDFALPLNEVDPCVPRVVVDEGDEISTPAKTNVLCRPPYIEMYQVELVPAPVTLVPILTCRLHNFGPSRH